MNTAKSSLLLMLLGTCFFTSAMCQDMPVMQSESPYNLIDESVSSTPASLGIEFSVTAGTTGVGFDVSYPFNNTFSLRGGYAIMPHLNHTMHFGVEVGDDPSRSKAKFDRLSGLLSGFTGYEVDDVVDMVGEPTYWNWKLMVDVKPFRNKHWHFTAGMYYGSRQVAKAVNAMYDMPSLMAVGIYNNLYDKAVNNEPYATVNETSLFLPTVIEDKLKDYGMMSIHIGDYSHDILYEEDVVATETMIVDGNIIEEGDIIHHAGDVLHAKGDAYRMVPDENSMVSATAHANRWKPYLGFGYGGCPVKGNERIQLSFDCGAMFWGGTPKIVTHDGTDLVNDVENVRGKVGDYVEIIKQFKVFPVLNLRVSYRLF